MEYRGIVPSHWEQDLPSLPHFLFSVGVSLFSLFSRLLVSFSAFSQAYECPNFDTSHFHPAATHTPTWKTMPQARDIALAWREDYCQSFSFLHLGQDERFVSIPAGIRSSHTGWQTETLNYSG
jgi:hypothetical protein